MCVAYARKHLNEKIKMREDFRVCKTKKQYGCSLNLPQAVKISGKAYMRQQLSDFFNQVNKRIMDYRCDSNRGAFGLDELSENFIFAYYGANSALLYRQWVEYGKKMPIEDAIQLATKLICNRMSSVVQKA